MRYLLTAVLVLGLAACGGSAPRRHAAAPAPVLLSVQRNGVTVATRELLTVHRDGHAELDKSNGRAGRRVEAFRIAAARMAQIRRGLARLPARLDRPAAPSGAVTFLLRVGGRTYVAQAGAMGRVERPLIHALDDVIAGGGRA